jgi:hypothetical protein
MLVQWPDIHMRLVNRGGNNEVGVPCFLCDDPDCVEWHNVEWIDESGKVIGTSCHLSECKMEDI